MISNWTQLARTSVQNLPMASLLTRTWPRARDACKDISVGSSGASVTQPFIEAALSLALDTGPDGQPDFLFEVRLPPGSGISIWHPDNRLNGSLDHAVLTTIIEAFVSGELLLEGPSSILAAALNGETDLRGFEASWGNSNSIRRCWQISTQRMQDSGNGACVVGLVRDISEVRDYCEGINRKLDILPQSAATCGRINSTINAAVREQAHLIASICDLLAEPPQETSSASHCRRQEFAGDMRAAVAEIITASDLMRDYTEASFGTLELKVQRWPLAEVIAHASGGLRRQFSRHEASLTLACAHQHAALRTDLPRLSRLLQVVAAAVAGHTDRDTIACIECRPQEGGGARIEFTYSGRPARLDDADEPQCQHIDPLHPSVSGPFCRFLLDAHGGRIEQAGSTGRRQCVTVVLNDCRAMRA